jgi:23S rRNA (uracil1939-C5)-methyltransferase
MHLSAEAQRAGYARILQDAFERIGRAGDLPRIDVLPSPARFGYRSRARVAVERGRVGFRARASRNVVDVERCAVLDPETQEELERLRARPPAGPVEVEIRGFGEKVELASGEMRVGPRSFFQPNRRLWEDWQSAVAERCGRGRCLVELYAGAGFYTALLTRRFDRVVAVEKGPAAKDARLNTTAEVIEASAESWAPRYMAGLAPEVVLVNPPRAGCHASVLRAIREAGPRRCVYVSCEPTTLARDAERLAERYRVMEILLIDALPQTHHVEAVCVLGREGSGGSSSDAC